MTSCARRARRHPRSLGSRSGWVGEVAVLVVQLPEQFLTKALAFAEEHPTRTAFEVEAEDARCIGGIGSDGNFCECERLAFDPWPGGAISPIYAEQRFCGRADSGPRLEPRGRCSL